MAEKVIDISTFHSATAAQATSEKFSDFARTVTSRLRAKAHTPKLLHLAPSDPDSSESVATILGLRDEVALFYRLSALRELPLRANYFTVPLGVEQVDGRVLAGGLRTAVLERAQLYWHTYHQPLQYEQGFAPYNIRIGLGSIKLKNGRLDEEGMKRLLDNLNVRIELDEGANSLAAHIVSFKDVDGHLGRPSILNWPETCDATTMMELGQYFVELQSQLSPGWEDILGSPSGPMYQRPGCFVASVAYEHGYKTVRDVEPIVSLFFQPHRPSLRISTSLPNLGPALNDCIDSLARSLSLTTISSLVG
jgi:hypothetical protein